MAIREREDYFMNNKKYPLYKTEKIYNLKEMVNLTAKNYGDRTAFSFEFKKETINVSYHQFKADVEALGTALSELGIQNAKIALIGENSYEWILTYFAVVNSGNIIIPLDKELQAANLEVILNHSEAEMFVYSDDYADIAIQLRNRASFKHSVNMNILQEYVDMGRQLIHKGKKDVVEYTINNNKMASLMYTSGTTGNPKGVMLSHKNLASNTMGICQHICFPESSLLILPLHHIASLVGGVLSLLLSGSTIAINHSLKELSRDFAKYKPQNVLLVPMLIETYYKQMLIKAGDDKSKENLKKVVDDFFGGNLITITGGGAHVDGKYVDAFRSLGIPVIWGYGLTETAAIVSVNRNDYYNANSEGQVISFCEVKISDPDETGHGEIFVKGDIVMLGYYKNEQATKEAFSGDWFKTGDIGFIDQDGFLFITGRKKNLMILSNGKNVCPEELEFALMNFSYIKEAVVYSTDNTIIAELFLDTETYPDCKKKLDSDILNLNRTLPKYKNIGKTLIRETEFPKTTTKKIKRQYR